MSKIEEIKNQKVNFEKQLESYTIKMKVLEDELKTTTRKQNDKQSTDLCTSVVPQTVAQVIGEYFPNDLH